jgi:hypothetical protein
MTIKINALQNDKIAIYTPYNPEFVAALKKRIGGCRWNADGKCWTAPASAVENVREIMRDVYGADDQQAASEPTCKVRMIVTDTLIGKCAPATAFGRIIASATGRDSGARLGDGVALLQGRVYSDGSFKNWKTCIDCDSVLEISDVPVSKWQRYLDSVAAGEDLGYTAERIDAPTVNHEALEAEKVRLLARLAEIEKLLNA